VVEEARPPQAGLQPGLIEEAPALVLRAGAFGWERKSVHVLKGICPPRLYTTLVAFRCIARATGKKKREGDTPGSVTGSS
jgi:hypothetical protein